MLRSSTRHLYCPASKTTTVSGKLRRRTAGRMVELYAAFTVLPMDNGTWDAIIITLAGILAHFVWYIIKYGWRVSFGNSASETQKPHSDVENQKLDNGERESEVTKSKLKHDERLKRVLNTQLLEKLYSATDEFLNRLSKPDLIELLNVARDCERRDIYLENLRKERDEVRKDRDYVLQQRDEARKDRDYVLEQRNEARKDLDNARKDRDEACKERDNACKDRDKAHIERDDALKKRDGARIQRDGAYGGRDYAQRERDDVCKQRDGAYKERDELRKAKHESDEKYNNLSQDAWKDRDEKIYLLKQRYDERLRRATEQTIAAKAASLEGKFANCSGTGTGGGLVSAVYAKSVLKTEDSSGQVGGGHEHLQRLRDETRRDVGVVADRSYQLYSWMLWIDLCIDRNQSLGVKDFEDLRKIMDGIGGKLDYLVAR
ncbi:hypothetical protein V502_10238 [Pseudogymnoascus sp. VKM F-4520 (FW-2644)]|nr:hypothetical protein V502_10238 [Pseudogymnoascus sp. VKM F-4520 (FW-2644)]